MILRSFRLVFIKEINCIVSGAILRERIFFANKKLHKVESELEGVSLKVFETAVSDFPIKLNLDLFQDTRSFIDECCVDLDQIGSGLKALDSSLAAVDATDSDERKPRVLVTDESNDAQHFVK
jgi:hypothetical protein